MPHQWVRRHPLSPPTVVVLPTATHSPERRLHAPGIFLARVDHVSSNHLSPPRLAAFFGGSSVSHWQAAFLWPRVALTRHQRWLPLSSSPGLCCWLFPCFCVVSAFFCNILTVFCLYIFCGWILVSLADPFSRAFDLFLVVPAVLFPFA